MKRLPIPKLRRSRSGSERSAFTYVELVMATISAGALIAGLASTLYTAGRAFDAGDSAAGLRIKSAEVLGDVMNDLRHAKEFSIRTPNAVRFTVPDRDGDAVPEVLSYAWSGTPGDPLLYSYNGGAAAAIARDVHQFDLTYVSHLMLAQKSPPMGGSRILFVVNDAAMLTASESGREEQLVTWGYEVTVISDSAPQTEFDAAFSSNDVVFLSGHASPAEIGGKLANTSIGIVSEHSALTAALGFAAGPLHDTRDNLRILSNNHYITTDFAVNQDVSVLGFRQTMAMLDRPISPDAYKLADTRFVLTSAPSLVTLDPGDELHNGVFAKGRMVQLPWGPASINDLTGDGLSLMRRSIEWAAGAGDPSPATNVLMIVADASRFTSQELQRRFLLESWGFGVEIIAATETQANIEAAFANVRVCYVHSAISDADLGTKLRHAPIGVVSESAELVDELGLRNGDGGLQKNRTSIEVIDRRHYITQNFSPGVVQIFSSNLRMSKFGGNLGDAMMLATIEGSNSISLATLSPGDLMQGGFDSLPAPAQRTFLPWGEPNFDISQLTTDGRTILRRALEWSGGAEANIAGLLLVVDDQSAPVGDERDLAVILGDFGYFITLISAQAPQQEFDTEIAAAAVIYVADTIDPAQLGNKLTNAPIGVVTEEAGIINSLGFADGYTSDGSTGFFNITDNSHYITEVFADGELELFDRKEQLTFMDGSEAAGRQTLGRQINNSSNKALVTIAAGETLVGGGLAAGRRVKLPWGEGYASNRLTADGLTVLERSLAWAAGLGDDGTPDSGTPTLGFESVFAAEAGNLRNVQVAMQVTLPEAGTFTSLAGYFYDDNRKLRYAIYTDNSGQPGILLTESGAGRSAGKGPEWTTLDVVPVLVPAGTYWIAFAMDDRKDRYYYEADASQQVHYRNYDTRNGFRPTWGTSDDVRTENISFYATYAPAN